MAGRLAKALDYPGRAELLADYHRRTAEVRAIYERILGGGLRPPSDSSPQVARAKPAFERGPS